MKIERLAGLQGKPEVVITHNNTPYVRQCSRRANTDMYGPIRKDERSAIRAWNAMVRRIRKANAVEKK